MATFDYLRSGEALRLGSDHARDFERIIGRRAVDAERFLTHVSGGYSRTAAGYLRIPSNPWRAHAHLDKFRELVKVERAKDADPGMIEVTYADGETDLIDKYGFLCVEHQIVTPEEETGK